MCSTIDDAADAISDAAQKAADAAKAAADAAAAAAEAAAEAAAKAAADAAAAAAAAAKAAAEQASKFGHELAHDAGAFADKAIHDPLGAAGDVLHAGEKAANAVGEFVSDNSHAILTGVEVVGTVALYVSGVGAPVAAAITGGIVAGTDAAEGKSAGDSLIDGGAAALDKLYPGAGSAAKAVANGIENGESPDQIAADAGLQGLGANGGPLVGFGSTIAHDAATGASIGQWARDLGNQYAASATGDQPLAQFGVAAINDAIDGRDASAYLLDAGRIYAHGAAGGDASPDAQLSDTFFNDLKNGKSLDQTWDDVKSQALGDILRVNNDAPGGLGGALGGSGIPGTNYGATALVDVAEGKSALDIGKDLTKQIGSDVGDQIAGDNPLKDSGIDLSGLKPAESYAKTAFNDLIDGKSAADIGADLGKQALHDGADAAGAGDVAKSLGLDSKATDPLVSGFDKGVDDIAHGKPVSVALNDALEGARSALDHVTQTATGSHGDQAQPNPDDSTHPHFGGPVMSEVVSQSTSAIPHGLGSFFDVAADTVGPVGAETQSPSTDHLSALVAELTSSLPSLPPFGHETAIIAPPPHEFSPYAQLTEIDGHIDQTTIHSGADDPTAHLPLALDHAATVHLGHFG